MKNKNLVSILIAWTLLIQSCGIPFNPIEDGNRFGQPVINGYSIFCTIIWIFIIVFIVKCFDKHKGKDDDHLVS